MSKIDQLLAAYERHIKLPLRSGLPTAQRVWLAVYPPEDERRLINRIDEFEMATRDAGHKWRQIDLQGQLTRWLDSLDEDERETWFRNPDDIALYAKSEWKEELAEFLRTEAAKADAPEETVFAITGLMELYDYLHVSDLLEAIEQDFPGFIALFFPGEKEGNSYSFMNARSGWNYLAVPIVAEN